MHLPLTPVSLRKHENEKCLKYFFRRRQSGVFAKPTLDVPSFDPYMVMISVPYDRITQLLLRLMLTSRTGPHLNLTVCCFLASDWSQNWECFYLFQLVICILESIKIGHNANRLNCSCVTMVHTHNNNSAVYATELLLYVWPFCDITHLRVKRVYLSFVTY